jgi:hypothetical protein
VYVCSDGGNLGLQPIQRGRLSGLRGTRTFLSLSLSVCVCLASLLPFISLVVMSSDLKHCAHANILPALTCIYMLCQAGRDIANACQAFGSGLFGAEAGQNAQFMIQAYSGSGEMLDGGGKRWRAM